MIISASRRTDIPAYYSDWFFHRLKERFVLVRNPMNARQISRIDLSPDVVDCIVFWTKNPKPMLTELHRLRDYAYYFQFTLTSYGSDIEPYVPSKSSEVIRTFQTLSDAIGPHRVVWRYDPILINAKYSADYHIKYFERLCSHLSGYTEKCVISFMEFYSKISTAADKLGIVRITDEQKREIARSLAEIAAGYGLKMEACAQSLDFEGIERARCIDDRLISRIVGCPIVADKDKNQRLECGCVESIDIGLYNTCRHGCKYCYANHSAATVESNADRYDVHAPLLCGEVGEQDKVYDRDVKSLKDPQLKFSI